MESLERVGDYRLGPELGSGLTGTVYRATVRRGGQQRAAVVKVCHAQRSALAPAAERLLQELDPRLVRYEELGGPGQAWSGWYATCPVKVCSPEELEREPLERRLALVRDVAEVVALLHAEGIVHGSLKPSNVLVRRERSGRLRPLVTDVGVTPRYDPEHHDLPRHAVRLYPYLAPEALLDFRGGKPIPSEPAVDVYALGALLCAFVSGQAPGAVEGEVLPGEVLAAKERRTYMLAALVEPRSRVDLHQLDRLLRSALDPDPGRRPSAVRFADVLQASLSSRAPRAHIVHP